MDDYELYILVIWWKFMATICKYYPACDVGE
jgi:hypothetical protein